MKIKRMKNAVVLILGSMLITTSLSGCGSLVRSSAGGDVEKIKSYLDRGEKVNGVGKDGLTPLMWAVYYGQVHAVELLLKRGADINYRIPADFGELRVGSTPLMMATYHGYDNIVIMLLKYGADKNIVNANNETAMIFAHRYNFLVLEIILSNEKDGKKFDQYAFLRNINIQMNNGTTILGKVINQDRDTVQVKTEAGIIKLNKVDILFLRIDE
jgi:ankyrin repeat protein